MQFLKQAVWDSRRSPRDAPVLRPMQDRGWTRSLEDEIVGDSSHVLPLGGWVGSGARGTELWRKPRYDEVIQMQCKLQRIDI